MCIHLRRISRCACINYKGIYVRNYINHLDYNGLIYYLVPATKDHSNGY